MFQQLDGFGRIMVTGPQRSGTRFAARAIAKELRMHYMDEEDFVFDNREHLERELRKYLIPVVVQCPGLMHVIHEYDNLDTCIVVMLREKNDIRKSMKRIGWQYEEYEKQKYAQTWLNDVPPEVEDIVDLKYYIWENRQKNLIHNYQEIQYESLQSNLLWKPEEERKHFGPHQTY